MNIHSPRVILRRLWDKNAYRLWYVVEKDGLQYYAKPTHFETDFDGDRKGFFLPEPTIEIPSQIAKQIFEEFVSQLEMQGESATQPKQVIDAKNKHLDDLRLVVSKLLENLK